MIVFTSVFVIQQKSKTYNFKTDLECYVISFKFKTFKLIEKQHNLSDTI